MTAMSTIAGMIPVAIGLGEGAESRAPMGACVVGGMMTSTVLTLVVIPVVYSMVDDVSGWIPALVAWIGRLGNVRLRGLPVETPVAVSVSSRVAAKSVAPHGRDSRVNVEVVVGQDPRSGLPD